MPETDQKTRGVIVKYDLANETELMIPAGARVLSVGWQRPHVRLWMLVDPQVPKVKRRVLMLSTGHEIVGDNWEFCGTAQAPIGLVFHVFLETV